MTTTRYHLALSYHVTGDGTEVERLEEHLDRVAEQLLALDGIIDPDLGAELATGRVTFTLEVDAKTPEAALHIARS
uniref:hypothetical protein n=1 Tax=Intrasporangium sp. TaxID=1925024 RepID=UPI00322173A3